MLEELRQRGGKFGFKRSIIGIIGAVVFFLLCQFNVLELGRIMEIWPWFVPLICAVVVLLSIINWIKAVRSSITRDIEKFCAKTPNPDVTMDRLERTWRDGVEVTAGQAKLDQTDYKIGKMDEEYIICADSFHSEVITLHNAVWVWKVDFKSGFGLKICYDTGKLEQTTSFTTEKTVDNMTRYIWMR